MLNHRDALNRLQGKVFCDNHPTVAMNATLRSFRASPANSNTIMDEAKHVHEAVFTCPQCRRTYIPDLGYFAEKPLRPRCGSHGDFLFVGESGDLICPHPDCAVTACRE